MQPFSPFDWLSFPVPFRRVKIVIALLREEAT